jgi:hypothetical protein
MVSRTRILVFAALLAVVGAASRAEAQSTNISPLAFGMTPQDAASALGSQLVYVRGKPGSEVFVTLRDAGIPSFYRGEELIFLQFRRGRLTGWKKDWRMRYGQLFQARSGPI